jgi:hypothetical protein
MALDNKQVAKELISYTIVTDKNALLNLLAKNGVRLSPNPSDSEVTTAVLVANTKSIVFKDELAKLLTKKAYEGDKYMNIVGNDQDFGFTGVDDVTYMPNVLGFTGWDDYQNAIGDLNPTFASNLSSAIKQASQNQSTGTKTKTKVGTALSSIWTFTKDNILTKENVNAGIQIGLNKINTDTAARQNALELQRAELENQQLQIRNQISKCSGASSNTIIYVVVGLIAIAGIGYVVYQRTKK